MESDVSGVVSVVELDTALLGCPLVCTGNIVLTSAWLYFDGVGAVGVIGIPSFCLVLSFKVSILFLTASACLRVSEDVISRTSASLGSISLLSAI